MNQLKRLLLILSCFATATSFVPQTALAVSPADRKAAAFETSWYGGDSCAVAGTALDTTVLAGSTNKEKAYNYFVGKGLTPLQSAAIVGNFDGESSVDPNSNQGNGGKGRGIAQWSVDERWVTLLAYAHQSDPERNARSLSLQLDFAWHELSEVDPYKAVLAQLKTYNDPAQMRTAVTLITQKYEIAGIEALDKRTNSANDILRQFGPGGTGAVAGAADVDISPDSGTGCGTDCTVTTDSGDGTIVLDPGHSPDTDPSARDAATGLYVQDYANEPEMDNVYKAAVKISDALKDRGYKTVVTKSSADDKLDLGERASRINATKGSLVVTLHTDVGATWLAYPDDKSKRTPKGGSRVDGTDGLVHPEVEAASEKYAKKMAPIVARATGVSSYRATSFADYYDPQGGIQGNNKNNGNTPVQNILTAIPQVYSEISATALNSDDFIDGMVTAISETIKKPAAGDAAPSDDAADLDSGACAATGSVDAAVQTAMKYAWPDWHDANYFAFKPAYKTAIDAADARGEYIGGGLHPGVDCGGFVTRVMRDSKADPNYNWGPSNPKQGNTFAQRAYLDAKSTGDNAIYQNLGNVSDGGTLKAGDIAINNDHTYMWVGPQSKHPTFHGSAASASWSRTGTSWRTPMAEVPTGLSNFTWFRLVKAP